MHNTHHDDHLEGHKAILREQARRNHIERARSEAKRVLEESVRRLAETLSQKNNNSL